MLERVVSTHELRPVPFALRAVPGCHRAPVDAMDEHDDALLILVSLVMSSVAQTEGHLCLFWFLVTGPLGDTLRRTRCQVSQCHSDTERVAEIPAHSASL